MATKFQRRLEMAMDMAHINARELANKTGFSEATISQYRSGYAKPRATDRIFILAQALGVSPSWLAGLDSPIQPTDEDAFKLYQSLSLENQLQALDYMRYLKSKENDNVSR